MREQEYRTLKEKVIVDNLILLSNKLISSLSEVIEKDEKKELSRILYKWQSIFDKKILIETSLHEIEGKV